MDRGEQGSHGRVPVLGATRERSHHDRVDRWRDHELWHAVPQRRRIFVGGLVYGAGPRFTFEWQDAARALGT